MTDIGIGIGHRNFFAWISEHRKSVVCPESAELYFLQYSYDSNYTISCLTIVFSSPKPFTPATACSQTARLKIVSYTKRQAACCKSKTGRHNQDRSRCSTNHRCILMRLVLILATGLGFATCPKWGIPVNNESFNAWSFQIQWMDLSTKSSDNITNNFTTDS